MIAVTEGIDAIATTRVLIRGENQHTATHALSGEPFQRTFRYITSKILLSCKVGYLCHVIF